MIDRRPQRIEDRLEHASRSGARRAGVAAIDDDPGRLIALDDLGGHAGKVGSGRDGNEINIGRQVGAERRQPRRGGTHPTKAERDLDFLASRAHVGRGKTDREGRELRVLRVQGDLNHGERLDEARDQSLPAAPRQAVAASALAGAGTASHTGIFRDR